MFLKASTTTNYCRIIKKMFQSFVNDQTVKIQITLAEENKYRSCFEQIVGKRISYSLSVLKLGIELGGDV